MGDEPAVLYDEYDALGVVTLNRPAKRNTLNEAVLSGLEEARPRGRVAGRARGHSRRPAPPPFVVSAVEP